MSNVKPSVCYGNALCIFERLILFPQMLVQSLHRDATLVYGVILLFPPLLDYTSV